MLQALGGIVEQDELTKALKGVDIIGDVAIIKLPKSLEVKKYKIGEKLISILPRTRCVFRQTAPASMGYKVRGIEWLAGEKRTLTTYSEHGCRFRVDVAKVYFSPRLSWERLRVAKLAKRNEVVVNMFAGVGTFSILMAKFSGISKAISIDKNPKAYALMLENIALNEMEGIVIPIFGDAKEVQDGLNGVADRVLMPLPELAIDYLPFALKYMKRTGHLHIYLHCEGRNKKEVLREGIDDITESLGSMAIIKSTSGRVVRSVGRRVYQLAIDVDLEKRES